MTDRCPGTIFISTLRTREREFMTERIFICEWNCDSPSPKHLLDRHYPHYCCKEMGGCGKRLHFQELMFSNQDKLYGDFKDRIWSKTQEQFRDLSLGSVNVCFLDILVRTRIYFKIYKYLKKLWKHASVQFLCCSCFNNKQANKDFDYSRDERSALYDIVEEMMEHVDYIISPSRREEDD